MGATPTYALRYPELDDPDDVPTDMHELALDVEAAITGASVPKPVVNGQWIKGAAGVPVWSAITAADLPPQAVTGYGTTLPASPADGQLHVLVDSLTNPSYRWGLRFNSQSSQTFKWEYVGGVPKHIVGTDNTGWVSNPAGVYLAFPGGPTFAFPRPGEYVVRFGAAFLGNTSGFTAPYTMYFRPMFNTTPTPTGLTAYAQTVIPVSAGGGPVAGWSVDNVTPALQAFGLFIGIYSSIAVAQSIIQPYFDIEPRRVS